MAKPTLANFTVSVFSCFSKKDREHGRTSTLLGPEGWNSQRCGPEGCRPNLEKMGPERWVPEGWGPEAWGPEAWGPEAWGLEAWGPEAWGPEPRKNGAPKGGAPKGRGPKISRFFSLSRHHFALFVSIWVSARGILVVFEAPEPFNVRVWSSRVVV